MIGDGYWEFLEKTKRERDELLSLGLEILKLYESELSRRREAEKALEKEQESSRQERDEALFVVNVNRELYEEEAELRRKAEEALEKKEEEMEEFRRSAAENQKLLETYWRERDEMLVERDNAIRLADETVRSLAEQDSSPPAYFFCPISHEIMRDPHVAADGFTYEAEEFGRWISSGGLTSPMTNARLPNLNLVPNHSVRSTIREWLQRHPNFLNSS